MAFVKGALSSDLRRGNHGKFRTESPILNFSFPKSQRLRGWGRYKRFYTVLCLPFTSILFLLASYRLSATFAKHGRLVAMCWLDVLEVVGVARIFELPWISLSAMVS